MKEAGADDCWLWTRLRDKDGYGKFHAGRDWRAARYAYSVAVGIIPEKAFVLHECDNPPCCNPAHLFLGDAASNRLDCALKGRLGTPKPTPRRGELNPAAKLTTSQVLYIREQVARGPHGTASKLARQFGVTDSTIHLIKINRKWSHL